MFSSRSFMVSRLPFKSLIYFKLISEVSKTGAHFHSFACEYPDFSKLFIEKTIFSLHSETIFFKRKKKRTRSKPKVHRSH